MTAVEIPKSTGRRTWAIGQVSALIVMLLILFFVWKRTRPERLTLVPDPSFTIAGENLYWPKAPDDRAARQEYTIQAQSIYGGKPQTIRREDAQAEFYSDAGGAPKRLNVVDGDLYYASVPRKEHEFNGPPSSKGGPVSIAMTRRFLGTFLQPPPSSAEEIVGQRRAPAPNYTPILQEVRFRHVSVQDGAARDLVSLRGTNFCQVVNSVFWVRAKPEEQNEVRQGRGYRLEVTSHSDLMLTNLESGVTHCIRTGIPARTSLTQGGAGVTWTEPQLYPNRPALFYARVSDGSVCRLGPVDTMGAPHTVEFAHRCYWIAASSDTMLFDQSQALMSANLDGSDRRVVFSQVDNAPVTQLALATSQGNLYCTLAKAPTLQGGRLVYPKYLCRVNPKRTNPIDVLRKLPLDSWPCQFADGYLYFILKEKHLTTWQVLTSDDLADGWTQTLCRFPLD